MPWNRTGCYGTRRGRCPRPPRTAVVAARLELRLPEAKQLLKRLLWWAQRCPCPCSRPLPSCPRRRCIAAWRTCRPPSFSPRRGFSPHRFYTFKHALTHEVAYGSLLQERRWEFARAPCRGHRDARARPGNRGGFSGEALTSRLGQAYHTIGDYGQAAE